MILGVLTSGNWLTLIAIIVPTAIIILTIWSNLKHWQVGIDTSIKYLTNRVEKLDEKFDTYVLIPLANSKSPSNLTDLGRKIFNRPKIQEFVKDNTEEIFSKMKAVKYESAYQAQEKLFDVVDSFKTGRYKINLENEAFETGQHIDILMKVIAIGIRDEIFARLGLKVEDIDNSKPTEAKTS
jgi:c-di-AMP phosphodiesterase-like protein